MSDNFKQFGSIVTSVDVSPASSPGQGPTADRGWEILALLLKEVVRLQQEQLRLQQEQLRLTKEILRAQHEARQRQALELLQWQKEHPDVVERCREALGALVRVHSHLLQEMAEHIVENEELMLGSEFSVSDFVDRFGPKLHHLSAALSVLKQVAAEIPDPQESTSQRRRSE